MKAIVTGGGTGGHIYPALAVVRALQAEGWDILYLGSKGGLESDIIPDNSIKFQEVDVAPLPRKITIKLISSVLKTTAGYIQARRYIKEYQPDLVFGTGGFVAGPVVLAGAVLKIPTLIHEQNVYPGFTNKILSKRVKAIALNFADAKKYFPDSTKAIYKVTGNPIREVILKTDRITGLNNLSLKSYKKTLLVFGGSQGSMSINNAMLDVYKKYKDNSRIQIIHITGKKNYNIVMDKIKKAGIEIDKYDSFKIMPYYSHMEYAYAAADLIIYRAGATGIAEITAKGLPSILIPYPYAAENHQEYNARNLEKHGAAVVILDSELSGQLLFEQIELLFDDEKKLKEMSENSKKLGNPEALNNIVQLIEKII